MNKYLNKESVHIHMSLKMDPPATVSCKCRCASSVKKDRAWISKQDAVEDSVEKFGSASSL